jgi:hypothetical protein
LTCEQRPIVETTPAGIECGRYAAVLERLFASGHWLADLCSALISAHRLTGNLDFDSARLLLQTIRFEADLAAARRMIRLFPHLLGGPLAGNQPPAAAVLEATVAGCLSLDDLEHHCLGNGEPTRRRLWRAHLDGCTVCRNRKVATEEFLRVARLAVLRDELRDSGVPPPARSLRRFAAAPGDFPVGRLLLLRWLDERDQPRRDVGLPEEASPSGAVLLTNGCVPENSAVWLTGPGIERTGIVRYAEALPARWRIAVRLETPPAGDRP